MGYDLRGIRQSVSIAETAQRFGVKLERNGREWKCLCPFHQEDTPSFSIFPAKEGGEYFHCFGCHERGDVIDFVRLMKGVVLYEACEILGGTKDAPDTRPRLKVVVDDVYSKLRPGEITDLPEVGKKFKVHNPKSGLTRFALPAAVHVYRDLRGAPLGVVIRINYPDGGKETPTLRMSQHGWTRWAFDKPRPLYGLEQLS